MNLYLRLLWTLLRSWALPRIEPGRAIERRLRVWPGDLDLNAHMNNGRYLTILDLALVEFFVRTGFARAMLASGWRPMSGSAFIVYRRSLQPWQAYRVRICLAGADASWNYIRFDFLRLDGALCARGYVKGATVGRSGLVPNREAYAGARLRMPTRALPVAVQRWRHAEDALLCEPLIP